MIFWKIDCYDVTLEFVSPDPATLVATEINQDPSAGAPDRLQGEVELVAAPGDINRIEFCVEGELDAADVSRRHRWIRGDWQIAYWLLPRVPGPDARRVENATSLLSRWKIFDNLRRSLLPAALLKLLNDFLAA